MAKKELKEHEIELNNAMSSVALALSSMKTHGVDCPDHMYQFLLMHLTKASYILSKEVNTRGYRNN